MASIGEFKRREPKTKRSRRAVKEKEAKVVENPKEILFLRGANTSTIVNDAMTDLTLITKPFNKKLSKRNAFHPFEGQQHLEFLCFKNDCSLFCFGSDSKKRPHNIVLGRHFDFHLLDMVELGIVAMDRLEVGGAKGQAIGSVGSKPFFVFEGSEFDVEAPFMRLKNFFVDFFRGGNDNEINLDGCDRVIFVSLRSKDGEEACVAPSDDCVGTKPQKEKGNTVVCFRHYAIAKGSLAASYTSSVAAQAASLVAGVKLIDIGPNFDFELRRMYLAPPATFRAACRQPREVMAQEQVMQRNVSTDGLGQLRGQIHVGKQDVGELNLRRFKAHRSSASRISSGDEATSAEATGADPVSARPSADEATSRRRKRKRVDTEGTAMGEVDI